MNNNSNFVRFDSSVYRILNRRQYYIDLCYTPICPYCGEDYECITALKTLNRIIKCITCGNRFIQQFLKIIRCHYYYGQYRVRDEPLSPLIKEHPILGYRYGQQYYDEPDTVASSPTSNDIMCWFEFLSNQLTYNISL